MLRHAGVGAIALVAALLAPVTLVAADSTTEAKPFTPTDMLSTPRPAPAIAAPGGQHALSLVGQWDPDTDV